jgi:hypothetical protein
VKLLINLHNLVGLSIETTSSAAYRFFSAEYAHHLTEELPVKIPKVVLRFKESKIFSIPDGFVFHSHKVLARWAYKLVISESYFEINVIGNRKSISMIHHMLVHAAVRALASFENTLMLHAGAIVKDGKSFILTGQGGAGKTTTTSLLLANGKEWLLHADDYVFLSPNHKPKSLAYLTRAHLYRDLLSWVPGLRLKLTVFERMRLNIFSLIRAWSDEQLKWPTRLDLKRLWPDNDFAFEASPAGLFILERAEFERPQLIPLKFEEHLLNSLITMNFNEARHFILLLCKSNALQDCDMWIMDWKLREKRLLNAFMNKSPLYKVCLPKRFTTEDFNASIPELMNSLLV